MAAKRYATFYKNERINLDKTFMKPILFLFVFLPIAFTHCSKKTVVEFKIVNNSNFKIDSLFIEPNVSKLDKYVSIDSKESYKYESDMTNIPKSDGSYFLSYIINHKIKRQAFGYYTNGYPLERKVTINIDSEKANIIYDEY